jgi:hypothetical protein
MNYPTCVLFKSQALKDHIVTSGTGIHVKCTIWINQALPIRLLDVNQLVLFPRSLEDVRIGSLAYFAFELSELVTANMGVLFGAALCLNPLLQAMIVDILHTSTALAGGKQRVLFSSLVDPAEAAERKFLIETQALVLIILYVIHCGFKGISDFPLLIGIHLCDQLFIVLHDHRVGANLVGYPILCRSR